MYSHMVRPKERVRAGPEVCRNDGAGVSKKSSKKSSNGCYLCKGKHRLLRCVKCELAWHVKCAALPEDVILIDNQPGKAVCWRPHPEVEVKINKIEDVFRHAAVPTREFGIESAWKDIIKGTESEPPPYVDITRNKYLVKMKKQKSSDRDAGCATCTSPVCAEDCTCRYQSISCSKACSCKGRCTNRPFRKQKRINVVKTQLCGWGVEAAEPIKKREFIIEYVGEVISDDMCKKRLSDLDRMNRPDVYMCEVGRNFTIDSTYKGNTSRFLNHSCDPNCKLERWQVGKEFRMGIFADRDIKEGEPLTYNYRFIPFGDAIKCHCGSSNCEGYLGGKKKPDKKKKAGQKKKPRV